MTILNSGSCTLARLMEIYTIDQAKAHLFKLVEYTAESHAPIYIVGAHNKAVLIAEEDYKAMLDQVSVSTQKQNSP